MARNKKSGVYFNGKIAKREYKALLRYADETGLTKTAVVEQAIRFFISSRLKKGMTLDKYAAAVPDREPEIPVSEDEDVWETQKHPNKRRKVTGDLK